MVLLKCPFCKKIFEKEKNKTHLQKKGKFTACSRKCSTTFGALLQHYPEDEDLLKALKENVIKEFVRH